MSFLLAHYHDAIICDLAEYYHIYNYEEFNPLYISTLVEGLGGYSRLKRELTGYKYTEQDFIQAKIADLLSLLLWSKTKDGQNNRNRPEMIVDRMINKEKEVKQDFAHDVFDSKEDFLKAREEILKKYK